MFGAGIAGRNCVPRQPIFEILREHRWHAVCSSARMTKEELQHRSLSFAAGLRPLTESLRVKPGARNACDQLLDASSSMAANYRAACRARSRAEFIAKLGTVVEESDESVYWLEYIVASGLLPPSSVAQQLDEARQLRSIFAASLGTSRDNYRRYLEDAKRGKRNRSTNHKISKSRIP